MIRSKFVMTTIVVFLILSFTISSVAADVDPPVVVDPEGGETAELPDLSGFTLQNEDDVPEGTVTVNSSAYPVSPAFEYTYSGKPTFYFTRDINATMYEIDVYATETSSSVYTFKGTGTCTTYYCSLKPTTKLPYKSYWDDGYYTWSMRAKVGGVWQSWSSSVPFIVLSRGFNDTFDTDTFGIRWWQVQIGNWDWIKTATKSQFKTEGDPNYWSSIMAKDYFENVDYTVRMKRKTNETNSNAVIIWGDLWPIDSSYIWNDGIYFQYDNAYWYDGKANWSIFKMDDGAFSWINSWTPSAAIKPYGWNELRIVAMYPYVDLYINGTYLGWFMVSSPGSGIVGVSMAGGTAPYGPLLVDWAKATPIRFSTASVHDPNMQLGLEAVPAEVNPTGAK